MNQAPQQQPPRLQPPPPQEVFFDPEETETSIVPSGPSTAAQIAGGVKHIAKNYAWPFTRDILAPATADLGVELTKGAAWLIGKSFWSLADIIWAMNADNTAEDPPAEPTPALGWLPSFRGPSSSVGAIGSSSSSSSGHDADVEELSKRNKGYLVEEIYKQPGWAKMFGREDERGYSTGETAEFRKRLSKMSSHDLAEVLTRLRSSG